MAVCDVSGKGSKLTDGNLLKIQCVHCLPGSSGECTVKGRKRQCQYGAEM